MLSAATTGCLRREAFPVEPKIAFKSLDVYTDSASLSITFTDGDGDVGLDPGDTLPPFQPSGAWFNNFLVDYYKRVDGVWEQEHFVLPLHYRVPNLTPSGNNKALDGTITVALQWPIVPGSEGDSIRLDVRLVDRALHVSNTVSSPTVLVR